MADIKKIQVPSSNTIYDLMPARIDSAIDGSSSNPINSTAVINYVPSVVFGTNFEKLGNESDLNDIKTPGRYLCSKAKSAYNLPILTNDKGYLIVESLNPDVNNDYFLQTFFVKDNNNILRLFKRVYQSSWTNWSEIKIGQNTLAGYGIADAYIDSGVIYLGSNSITPLIRDDVFGLGTLISSSSAVNLNSYDTSGIYYFNANNASNLTNCPVTNIPFRLEVKYVESTSTIIQTIYPSEASVEKIYRRIKKNSLWSDWESFYTIKETISTILGEESTAILSNVDLDDYYLGGVYSIADDTIAGTISNIPVKTEGGKLIVQHFNGSTSATSQGFQLYFPNSASSNDVYLRNNVNGNWSSWTSLNSFGIGYSILSSGSASDKNIFNDVNLLITPGRYNLGDDEDGVYGMANLPTNNYALLTFEPSDWATKYKKLYFTKSVVDGIVTYNHITGDSAPTFAQNTYYKVTIGFPVTISVEQVSDTSNIRQTIIPNKSLVYQDTFYTRIYSETQSNWAWSNWVRYSGTEIAETENTALGDIVDQNYKVNVLQPRDSDVTVGEEVQFHINNDGSVTATVVATKVTQNRSLNWYATIPAGRWVFSTNQPLSGGTGNPCYAYLYVGAAATGRTIALDYDRTEFVLSESTSLRCFLQIRTGTPQGASFTFYPMVCDPKWYKESKRYVPYVSS